MKWIMGPCANCPAAEWDVSWMKASATFDAGHGIYDFEAAEVNVILVCSVILKSLVCVLLFVQDIYDTAAAH